MEKSYLKSVSLAIKKSIMELISEYEDLLKIKDFHSNKSMRMPMLCTREKIAKGLKYEYSENIDEKIDRWIDITNILYFESAKCIPYYFQAKMLYRDGFYESAIMLTRSICEMTCYDLLSKIPHPFGDLDSIEVPMYRVFVDYLALPKVIEKNVFEKGICDSISDLSDNNLVKSSYSIDNSRQNYFFKIENGKDKNNLKRFFRILNEVSFSKIDNFSNDSHKLFHDIYDIANLYVHSKASLTQSKDDARKCILMLTQILSEVYGVKSDLIGTTIKSGYMNFPDICKGMNFAIEFGVTVEDAQRIMYNIPHEESFEKLRHLAGTWSGRWKNVTNTMIHGDITFIAENKDFIDAHILYIDECGRRIKEPLEIRLFDDYIHLVGFNPNDKMHKKLEHVFFELDFFSDDLLIGETKEYYGKVIFERMSD